MSFLAWLLNRCRSSPAQLFLVPTPTGLMLIFYSLTALGAFRYTIVLAWSSVTFLTDHQALKLTVLPTDRIAARYLLCLMFFLGITVTFILRVNINLAIVGMVNSTSLDLTSEGTQSNASGTCLPIDGSVSTNKQVKLFLCKLNNSLSKFIRHVILCRRTMLPKSHAAPWWFYYV
jgi:hypothetical protein